jgi:SAM-dependent methyltransferase
MASVVNQRSPEEWTGDRVARWLRQSAGLERQLSPASEVLLAAARLLPGESVLDVGCGTGPTTYAAALEVGATGHVTGLDVSPEMLAAAASTPHPDRLRRAPIDWIEADAVTWNPADGRYDAIISRFGVMFFSDPLAAFANLALAARSGGRLAMAVWQRLGNSEVFSVPLHAALAALRSRGILSTTAGLQLDDFVAIDDEGPFSLHDPDTVSALLSAAGWSDIAIEPHLLNLPFAGGLTPSAAANAALDFGPTRILLNGLEHAAIAAAESAISAAFADYTNEGGKVILSGAINVITAARP